MRPAPIAAILLAAATASADPETIDPEVVYYHHHQPSSGLWLDVGALWARVDAGTDAAYSGKLVRFAPHASIGRTFYLGAEVDIGTIDGAAPAAMPLGRGSSSTMPLAGVTGSLAAIKGVAGARLFAGPISAGAELAAGMRHAAVEDMYGKEVTAVGDHGVVEAHARLDWWATPGLTLGALAGVDVLDSTNLVFGVELGVHFTDYDNVRR